MQLLIKIRLYGKHYTVCLITEDVVQLNKDCYAELGLENPSDFPVEVNDKKFHAKDLRLVTSALFLKPFLKECINSSCYRANVIENIKPVRVDKDETLFLKLILQQPDQEIIDYGWNERMLKLTWMRVELENAFSWLSTLGGAYSALGDYFEYCAEEAGRISMRQYKLSKLLGDEGLAARSKLYSALSTAQKGNLKLARHVVRHVAQIAQVTKDRRLMKMCHGVWAKLKYMRTVAKSAQHLCKEGGDGIVANGKVYVQ